MSEKNNTAGLRKCQEDILNLLNGGYYKELCLLQKAMYDEYIKIGFDKEQALQLTMSMGRS